VRKRKKERVRWRWPSKSRSERSWLTPEQKGTQGEGGIEREKKKKRKRKGLHLCGNEAVIIEEGNARRVCLRLCKTRSCRIVITAAMCVSVCEWEREKVKEEKDREKTVERKREVIN